MTVSRDDARDNGKSLVEFSFSHSSPIGATIDPDSLEVLAVAPGSQAAKVGVKLKSIVRAVNGHTVQTHDEFDARCRMSKSARDAEFTLRLEQPPNATTPPGASDTPKSESKKKGGFFSAFGRGR